MAGKKEVVKDEIEIEVTNETISNLDLLDSDERIGEQEADALQTTLNQQTESVEMSEADAESAKQGALMAVGFLEQIVKSKMPMVEYTDDQKLQLGEKIAPVMGKYGAGLPDWMTPYKEEIELGICLGSMAFTTYLQYQAFLAQQRIEADKAQKSQAGDTAHGDAS
mgnify:CR=1 FL=1